MRLMSAAGMPQSRRRRARARSAARDSAGRAARSRAGRRPSASVTAAGRRGMMSARAGGDPPLVSSQRERVAIGVAREEAVIGGARRR